MITSNPAALLQKLNEHATRALEAAASLCTSYGHAEVTIDHLLQKLIDDGTGDVPAILSCCHVDAVTVQAELAQQLRAMASGHSGRPAFSPLLLDLIEAAWLVGSVQHGGATVRSGFLLAALVESKRRHLDRWIPSLSAVSPERLRKDFSRLVAGSVESTPSDASSCRRQRGTRAITRQFTDNLTRRADDGHIDPVFGRNEEIRQIVDALSRRRKNNALLVGDAGTGKTAIVEGLALRIAAGNVPDTLRDVALRSLDMGSLLAGASVKGAFEERVRTLLQEIEDATTPTVLFIDEAHTLIGAGGHAGTGDAANLLKPMLARGSLRVIAATTWLEYKRHIEKDPALERRFQRVPITEPTVEETVTMLRGLKQRYEDHHGVQISEDAVHAIATLSDRYVSGRKLPDKAFDLLDTAAARARMTQTAKPEALNTVERQLQDMEIEAKALTRDLRGGRQDVRASIKDVQTRQQEVQDEKRSIESRWRIERDLAHEIIGARDGLQRHVDHAAPPKALAHLRSLQADLDASHKSGALVYPEVNAHLVANVVSDWTGIPVGTVVRDEAASLLELEAQLRRHIRGQNEAIEDIATAIRSSKAGLSDPQRPIAVFLLVGPSGVGKTETARQLASVLFGGDAFLTTINMSEYQERHTVSQLKGAPPGYAGYGDGGVLTEAVRQHPYSVVLLDEVEKAHSDALELFYQVFDKGFMRDGEGCWIDFRNTIIMMTSNVGADLLFDLCDNEDRPEPATLRASLHPRLLHRFQAALLARMHVVPYYPLSRDVLRQISRIKLDKVGNRLHDAHGMAFEYSGEVVDALAGQCSRADSGARNIDEIIQRTLLPEASKCILQWMMCDEVPRSLQVDIDDSGDFTYAFGERDGSEHSK